MSSKRRIRRKACEGKQRHDTQAAAHVHVVSLWRKDQSKMRSYHCQFCKGWHVGHKPT